MPVIGRLLRAADQIPVYRNSTLATSAFREAVRAVEEGECIFPRAR